MSKRKLLAAVLAFTLLFGTVPGAVLNADSIGKEAQACKELGILIGADASGVSPQYLATTPARIQAFIIFLRLKGLYDEATSFEGSANFKDADATGWAKNYMAYAKSKPELGWIGQPDGTFAPNDKINGQAFYKVMLETLGYKQGIDFAYADVFKFAEQIKLIKSAADISKIGNFTVNDMAVGICSALNTKPLNADKKLISIMVDNRLITAEKAIAAGFTLDTTDAAVIGFKNLANNKLEIEFDKEINLQKGDIEISQLDQDTRLSVLSIYVQNRKATIITTEAKAFTAYGITINSLLPTNNVVVRNYKNKYVALPIDNTKATVKHELLSNSEILVTFSKEVDKASAENMSNYFIEHNVIVLAAQLDEAGKSVLLKTTDMYSGNFYRLTVQNVTDISGNAIERYTSHFDGLDRDYQEPSVQAATSENNQTVLVVFNERVDATTAENTGNYIIDSNVSVISAKADLTRKTVRLTTSLQSSGTIYKLTIRNVADASGNIMSTKEFRFVSDTAKPSASVLAISGNELLVTFNKVVDKRSAEDASNYIIDNDVQVLKALLDGTGKSVTLITSDQTVREVYTINILNIFDLWGNTMVPYHGRFAGSAQNNKELSFTVGSSGGSITVTFNKRVDRETAEDVFNYILDSSLGHAARATLDSDATGRVVTLLTAPQTPGKTYTLTVENVTDVAGSPISSDDRVSTKRFAGTGGSIGGGEAGTLSLEAVSTVDMNTIDLIFNNTIAQDELNTMGITVQAPSGYSYSLPSDLEYYKYYVGSKSAVRVQFKTSASNNPEIFRAGNIYTAKVTGIERLSIKDDANIKPFAGTSVTNEAPTILEVVALNSTAVEVVFSEPVKGITSSQFSINNSTSITGTSVASGDVADRAVLYLSGSTQLEDGTVYRLTPRSGLKDGAGLNALALPNNMTYWEFDGNSVRNEAPTVVSDVEVIDSYTLRLEFSEPIKTVSGSMFSIKRLSGTGGTQFIPSKAELSEDKTMVTVYMNSRNSGFNASSEYELTVASGLADMQGMSIDSDSRKLQFTGTDTGLEALQIITAVASDDNRQLALYTNRSLISSELSMDYFELTGAGYYKSSYDRVEQSENCVRIILRNALNSNSTLNVKITASGQAQIRDYNSQRLSTETLTIQTN